MALRLGTTDRRKLRAPRRSDRQSWWLTVTLAALTSWSRRLLDLVLVPARRRGQVELSPLAEGLRVLGDLRKP